MLEFVCSYFCLQLLAHSLIIFSYKPFPFLISLLSFIRICQLLGEASYCYLKTGIQTFLSIDLTSHFGWFVLFLTCFIFILKSANL